MKYLTTGTTHTWHWQFCHHWNSLWFVSAITQVCYCLHARVTKQCFIACDAQEVRLEYCKSSILFHCAKAALDLHNLEVNCQSLATFQKPSHSRFQMSLRFLENMHCNRVNTRFSLDFLLLFLAASSSARTSLHKCPHWFWVYNTTSQTGGCFAFRFLLFLFCTYIIQSLGYVPPWFSCQACQCSYVAVTQISLKHKTRVWKWRGKGTFHWTLQKLGDLGFFPSLCFNCKQMFIFLVSENTLQ